MQELKEDQLVKQLFKEILRYYKKLMNNGDDDELPPQEHMVQDVQVCFRIMCQIVDSFLQGYNELKNQYSKLEDQLIQKETESRKHIQIQQQLKLYAEDLQDACEEMSKQLEKSNSQIIQLSKEIVRIKKQLKSSSQERLMTDTTQDRLSTIVTQQKQACLNKTTIKIPKKKVSQNVIKSITALGQTMTIEDLVKCYGKKKTKNPTKLRSNTIHVTESKPAKQKPRMHSINLNEF